MSWLTALASAPNPHMRKTRQWIRACGKISPAGGQDTHLGALAYMSDTHFVGTVPLVHFVIRYSPPELGVFGASQDRESSSPNRSEFSLKSLSPTLAVAASAKNAPPASSTPDPPKIGMMVSLDHSIYFHRPRDVVADDWLLSENESPWSGEGRGLVIQKIWSRQGRLLATCVQEVGALFLSLLLTAREMRQGMAVCCIKVSFTSERTPDKYHLANAIFQSGPRSASSRSRRH